MIAFDWLTPSFVVGHLAFLICVLTTMAAVTFMYMAGGYTTWLLSPNGASVLKSPDVAVSSAGLWEIGKAGNMTDFALWGARVVSRRIGNNTHLPDQYLADWGALSPSVMTSNGRGLRYLTSLLVHKSWWHFLILIICTVISGAIMERRCAPPTVV